MPIERDLDRLVQSLSQNQKCHICGLKKADAIHHIITRANPITRYELPNLLPVCFDCHRKIHDGKIDIQDYITKSHWDYLQEIKNKSFKDFLLFSGYTKADYYKHQKEILTKAKG